jgi:hypothetical protein
MFESFNWPLYWSLFWLSFAIVGHTSADEEWWATLFIVAPLRVGCLILATHNLVNGIVLIVGKG